jgi:G3E family GTPase
MNLVEEEEVSFEEPTFAPWDGRRVPVLLLGGYLGAGKTTVINEILARADVPIAVFVNDVGRINIDARLIERQAGDTLDLTGGCVCCSLKNGFLEAFDQLRSRATPPELVVVELSGIANPSAAAAFASTPGFSLDSIIVLVDLDQFLDREDETSVVADAVRAQVRSADLLLLTKRDLVSDGRVERVTSRLRELTPGTPIVLADSAHSIAGLVGLGARRPVLQIGDGTSLFDQHTTSLVPIGGTMHRSALESLVANLPSEVVRAKGIVQIETGELMVVQVVGKRRSIEPLPMAESTEPTDLVVVTATRI